MSANRMFVVLASVFVPTSTCLQATSEDNTQLWHCRYGHLNFKGLRTLLYKGMVRGLPMLKASSKVCGDCMAGKQHRDAMPKKSLWRASKKLQLVHADICGPISPASNSGKSQRKKLDNKSFKCVLLGVSEESKAYRLYDPISKKIVISRDIVCVEDEKWNWGRSAEEVKHDVLEWEGDNEDADANEEGEGLEDEQTEETDNSSTNESSEEAPLSPNQGRSRRQPAWLRDFVTGDELSDEEERHSLAPRAWYSRIEAYFAAEGFEKCFCEHTLFIKSGDKGKMLIVSLYVDDLIFTGNDEDMFKSFKESMKKEFDMSDLGRMKYFLGVEVVQNSDGIFICQRKYAKEVLERFGMDRSNPVTNPIVPGCKLSKSGSGAVNVDATENPVLHGRSKHIDVRFHFLRELTRDGIVELVHCSTQEQVSDIMTKPLTLEVFLKLRDKLGMCIMSGVN
ncbi:hypothetical protein MRB53_013112 [Persea americana]|uniref:Uncharacterized protein n=1 Tax=Persea americana TaxID=3435 RepID=A0ACC2K7E5_PERAE|nr:hypothetical protein MRB53_013112 [Persea americana]